MKSTKKDNTSQEAAFTERDSKDSGTENTATAQGLEILQMLYIVGITRMIN